MYHVQINVSPSVSDRCACMLFLRAAQPVYLSAWPGAFYFPLGGGAPGLPNHVLTLHPCLHHHVLVIYNMRASAHVHCRSYHPSITTICTALPACHLSCMSNKLIFLIYSETTACMHQNMCTADRSYITIHHCTFLLYPARMLH
jgi:hypothetical protein